MIKSTRNGYCDHVQDIRNLSARVENSGEFGMGVWLQFGRSLGWVFGCSLGGVWEGRGGMGKKKKEKQRMIVSADGCI